jgi:hypothetical protein
LRWRLSKPQCAGRILRMLVSSHGIERCVSGGHIYQAAAARKEAEAARKEAAEVKAAKAEVDARAEMTREAHGGTLKALGVTTQAAAEATTEADRLREALQVSVKRSAE